MPSINGRWPQALLRLKSRGAVLRSHSSWRSFRSPSRNICRYFRRRRNFGFFGISYVSFRALDVIFSIRDRVVTAVPPLTYFAFLFFFPTVSSGPIDRFRRFSQDWQRHAAATNSSTISIIAVAAALPRLLLQVHHRGAHLRHLWWIMRRRAAG